MHPPVETINKILGYTRPTTQADKRWFIVFYGKYLIPKYWQKKQNSSVVRKECDSLCTQQSRVTTSNPARLAQGPHGLWENRSTIAQVGLSSHCLLCYFLCTVELE